tara:strand:+ start:383 stop:598 length:216 start_codon:yes stop_codon:yes gene_type:complete
MEENEDISTRVRNIKSNINKLQKELESLQSKCKHKNYKVELRNGALVNVCCDCEKELGYSSKQDKEKAGYI